MRLLLLYIHYIYVKFLLWGKVKFNGFTVYYSFKNATIQIGANSIINSSSLSNLVGLYQRCILIARDGGSIIIGENAGISGSTIYSMNQIEIGNNVLIGGNCKIIDNDFHPLDLIHRHSTNREYIKTRPILIGNDCFIGSNTIVLKGTKLGNNCIVGAGSVVSGVFPDNVVIAGNPAKIIRTL